MKPSLSFLLAAALVWTAGCGKQEPASAAGSRAPAATADAPAADGVRTIRVDGNDAMRFTVTRIEARPGEEIRLELRNVGTMPKDVMGHNLVLLRRDADARAYANAALQAKEHDYLPPALSDQVIAATKLLGPKQTDTITFRAPSEPGEYPYICSFPAHFLAGMRGVLVVAAGETPATAGEGAVVPQTN